MKRRLESTAFAGVLVLFGCATVPPEAAIAQEGKRAPVSGRARAARQFEKGKDYVMLKRVRFLDREGFDRPVEAFSILFPEDWKTEGGIRWGSWNGCRGDMAASYVKASSPDGAIRMEMYPTRTFGWTSDRMMTQAMQMAAGQGGCGVNQPFDAKQYIEGFVRRDLGGQASNIRNDENGMAQLKAIDDQSNAIARQYGNNSQQTTTKASGDVAWPDGSEGIIDVAVTNVIMRKPDYVSGGVTTMTTTAVFHCILIRFPAARRQEASKLLQVAMSSHRMSPIWQKAKTDFLTEMSQRQHASNMERIRLMGEQSRAYARAQSEASDQRMRDWENRQGSQDRQHKQFVQAIREVETWKDSSGNGVELASGYDQAWSRGDGSYILSNSPDFDPRRVLQDQGWVALEREK